jgi:uncharacterized RDD family membrane protein YckC
MGMVLAAIPLMAGYAMILIDDRREGLHDKLAGTWILYAADDATEARQPLPASLGTAGAPIADRRRAAPPGTSASP